MSTTPMLIAQCAVKIDGADLARDAYDRMVECRVENSAHLPDVCTMRFEDDELELTDGSHFEIGKTVEVAFGYDRQRLTTVFWGEIVSLDIDLAAHGNRMLVVRALHKSHRLHAETKQRTFLDVTFSDLANQIAGEAGLTADADSTSEVYKWVCQHNETNWDFLSRLAKRCGYRLHAGESNKLCFSKVEDPTSPGVTLKWGENLQSFRLRMSASNQVNEVTVRGWDWIQKQAIVGRATSDKGEPQTGLGRSGGAVAQSAFGSRKLVIVNEPVQSQSEAEQLAQSALDLIGGSFLEADGLCFGDPNVVAGKSVKVENAGNRFSGTYYVSSATHAFTPAEGYTTLFSVTGKKPATISSILGEADPHRESLIQGVAVGIVTNNDDPENLGRIKVKFPWFSEQEESFWVKIASPMAGAGRGFQFLPEVDDEVLVAFEHGDIHRPYMLGALWNQSDAPVDTSGNNVKGGKVVQRTIKTRVGHYILLDDNDGAEKIYIKTSKNHEVTLDDGQKKIVVKTAGGHTITMDDQGRQIEVKDMVGSNKLTIDSNANSISMECLGNYDVKAKGMVTIEGLGGVTVKSPAMTNIEGTTTNVKGTGMVVVQGALVKIN